MSEEKKSTDKPTEKRGIVLQSKSPISLVYVKSPLQPNKFVFRYEAISSSPISVTFENLTNSSVFPDRSGSESEASDAPPHPFKKQKRLDERDLQRFWSSETGMLPEAVTRIPKSENAARVQHTMLLEACYIGKAHMASLRAENDRLLWEKERSEKEANNLKAKVLELTMRTDILERAVQRAKSESPPKEENQLVTPPKAEEPSRKSPPKYEIPAGASPNDSIFSKMTDISIRREDPAVIHASKRKPVPLMGIKTSPPTTGRPTTPTFNLRGTGHFSFATRGRGGLNNSTNRRGYRSPMRGRGINRYEDAIANHRWQESTFHQPQSTVSVIKVKKTVTEGSKTATSTTAGPPSPGPSGSSASTSGPPTSPTENFGRVTRSKEKQEKNEKVKEKAAENEESDDETLRCFVSKEDEEFMARRLLEDYEDMY